MAERQGFEPWRRFPAYTLSRRAPSTTRPPLRDALFNAGCGPCARGFCAAFSAIQMDRHAPVLTPLFLDLADLHTPDLASARHMGATTGLQVDLSIALTNPYRS